MLEYYLHGGIAQLGERLNGIQEVMGSIPTISTIIKRTVRRIVLFILYLLLFSNFDIANLTNHMIGRKIHLDVIDNERKNQNFASLF